MPKIPLTRERPTEPNTMPDPIVIVCDQPAPTEPGWYAFVIQHKGIDYEHAEHFHRDEDDGNLYYLTDEGYEVRMPENAKWSHRIDISASPQKKS